MCGLYGAPPLSVSDLQLPPRVIHCCALTAVPLLHLLLLLPLLALLLLLLLLALLALLLSGGVATRKFLTRGLLRYAALG